MTEKTLPDAAVLIEAAREAMTAIPMDPLHRKETEAQRRRAAVRVLKQWEPEINRMVDLAGTAKFLGERLDTVRRRRWRRRADGQPDWPKSDLGPSLDGWKLRTIVLHEAARPGRGRHGSATAPVPEDAAVYLAVSDIADHYGVAVNTVHSWRTRYPHDCPEPDVLVGLKHPQAGWLPKRMGEWDEFRASLPGRGAGGGRPKSLDRLQEWKERQASLPDRGAE